MSICCPNCGDYNILRLAWCEVSGKVFKGWADENECICAECNHLFHLMSDRSGRCKECEDCGCSDE